MWHLLEKIRAKPVRVRKQILFVTATFLTVIVFFVWVSTFISDISQSTSDNMESNKSIFSFLTPFQNAFTDIFETANKDTSRSKASFFESTNTYRREQPIEP